MTSNITVLITARFTRFTRHQRLYLPKYVPLSTHRRHRLRRSDHADQPHEARRPRRPSQGDLLNTQASTRQLHLSRAILLPQLAAGSRNAIPLHHTPLPVAGAGGAERGPAEDDHRPTSMLQHALPLLLERDAGV